MAGLRNALSSNAQSIDIALLWVVGTLLAIGLVMVYSASVALPDSPKFAAYKPTHFLMRHAFAIALAIPVGLVAFATPMRFWQRWAPMLFLACLVLLLIVLIPGVGKVVYGARRWLSLGFTSLQPSELMKLCVILYVADYTVRKQDYMQQFSKGFLPMGAAVAAVGLLLLLEPDLGAFVVIAAVAMGMLFLGGVNGKLFAGLVVIAVSTFSLLIMLSPWRRDRIFAYLDPFADPLGKGYQLTHSLIAFGRGEIFGQGLGGSVEKLHYLPEAHTDFLLAVIAEELGFAGVALVLVLFAWVIYRAWAIGRQAVRLERPFAALAAQGIGVWIGVQAFINIGVNMGVLPTKGLTLPLLSFGGSGIVANCLAMAILLRVDYENRRMLRGYPV